MNDTFYPDFDIHLLLPVKLVMSSLLEDPLWLDRPACPYDSDVKDTIRAMWLGLRSNHRVEELISDTYIGSEDKWTDVSVELMTLFNEIRTLRKTGEKMDAKEEMAYFRTATALLEKITGLGERAMNVKQVSDFQGKVLSVFDEILSPEQRTRAMEKLAQ